MLAGVDHIPHTYNRKEQAYAKEASPTTATMPMSWNAWWPCTMPQPLPP